METERKELLKMSEGKKYNVIYADPAWRFSQGINRRKDIREKFGTNEELSIQYSTMSDKEIIELNVADYADDNCVLFVWTTDAHLEVAIKAINNWGFKYKTVAFTWNKTKQNIVKSQTNLENELNECLAMFQNLKCLQEQEQKDGMLGVTKRINLKKKKEGKFLIILFLHKVYSEMYCSISYNGYSYTSGFVFHKTCV